MADGRDVYKRQALIFRTIGVLICLAGTALNWKERLFCVIAYLPKATVQAAIGSVPMAMGLPCGQIVLSVAVMAILITAPLGALGMDSTFETVSYTHLSYKIFEYETVGACFLHEHDYWCYEKAL